MVRIKICILFIVLLFVTSCPNMIWSGIEYNDQIDDDDNVFFTRYYDNYTIYYSGKWKIEFTSHDDVPLYLELKNNCTFEELTDELLSSSGDTESIMLQLPSVTLLTVYVKKDDVNWINNGKKAEYTIKATLL